MSPVLGWAQRQLAGIVAIILLIGVFFIVRPSGASAEERDELATSYRFTPLSIPLPGGFPQATIRKVNQEYAHIAAWISSVGAGIAMNDLDGDGLANDLCVTDVRIDRVVVAPTPGVGGDRYPPFALDPAPLPMNPYIAPMGCLPGDFNEDGRTDLLVYWWGRTPVIFLARPDVDTLSPDAYRPVEVVPQSTGANGHYRGPRWNTNAASVADFDGDGHDDLYIGNYFPDGPLLDHTVRGGVAMNRSMSLAYNGGDDHILRWTSATTGPDPTVSYAEAEGVFSADVSRGWTLAVGANDLDGDLLPELYIANDFGPDHLLHNRSTPGRISFGLTSGTGSRAFVPKSKRLGHDSFKGMGIDFGDLNLDGLYDIYVGNITTSFGIQESNFAFVNTAEDRADLRAALHAGQAPWEDRSSTLNLAWSGWSWDVKIGDFRNRGTPDIVQTSGFVRGEVNRWAQLQELATANDDLVAHPQWWPNVGVGDDIAGGQRLLFHAKGPDGRYVDVSRELGMAIPIPTRGIAIGDADGDGRMDLAVARQWDAPVFYHNDSPAVGNFLGLRLTHDTPAGSAPDPGPTDPASSTDPAGSPVIGAQVTVALPDGRQLIGRVDGGSGHSGRRSFEVLLGLDDVTGPVTARLAWRDRGGNPHTQELTLTPGWHAVKLGSQARKVPS